MRDLYQTVTDTIVRAIESDPGKVILPWHRQGGVGLPRNAHTSNFYNGVNVVSLWCVGMEQGYRQSVWATYRQWQEQGCQVRKGERGCIVIYYNTTQREDDDGNEKTIPFIKQSSVFNCEQVDGFVFEPEPDMPPLARIAAIEAFVVGTGAKVHEGGSRAYYSPTEDVIHLPQAERFFDTKTSTRTEAFYSTLFHEMCHWTGAKHRLARDMSGRFGNPEYAAEELVAELGAAFLSAKLNVTPEPRADHAAYINNWLQALKNDKRFIFSAAAQAQLAADYLLQLPD